MTDVQRPDRNAAGDDEILAYVTGQLPGEQRAAFEARLAQDVRLRDEVEILVAAADIVTEQRVQSTADASYARAAATLGLPVPSVTPDEPRRLAPPPRSTWLARLTDWWNSHAGLVQPALVALLLVQSGVIVHYMTQADDSRAIDGEVIQLRGSAMSCNGVWLSPQPDVDLHALMSWVLQYGGSIVSGPDTRGRLRIDFPDQTSYQGFVQDSVARKLAGQIEQVAPCGGHDARQ